MCVILPTVFISNLKFRHFSQAKIDIYRFFFFFFLEKTACSYKTREYFSKNINKELFGYYVRKHFSGNRRKLNRIQIRRILVTIFSRGCAYYILFEILGYIYTQKNSLSLNNVWSRVGSVFKISNC